MNEQVVQVPVGTTHPVMLQATLFKPSGPGPFPLVVMNHGKDAGHPEQQPRYRARYATRYFLSRGYAVVLPMLRGFAGSGGRFELHDCDIEADGRQQAADIRAVISYMAKQPDIDGQRIIVAGQSFGGWNTLAVGTLNYPGVRGLVNFSGGLNEPQCPWWSSHLADAAGHYGAATHVPSLWFYGDNDSIFSTSTWRGMLERYTASGGKAELVAVGNFLNDSHNMMAHPEGLSLWAPKVDAFLAKLGMPNRTMYARYLPTGFLPEAHYAAAGNGEVVAQSVGKGGAETRTAALPVTTPMGSSD
ncbi:CocE/NonD family hydrolase [Crenobacter sp. SG2303]|uniref:CocE/NonD family hydrolase n=1 Tax=Crenobacter oryzisoli TaxID=3056844 RepID=A0ABT7XS62_9NEIS|nr:CocE/NonD family hydrolase [Crenobacter sp. SG2303]MDN0076632.1 CocE/NonD family hydrolase [Crenobacter sp. SG2303]